MERKVLKAGGSRNKSHGFQKGYNLTHEYWLEYKQRKQIKKIFKIERSPRVHEYTILEHRGQLSRNEIFQKTESWPQNGAKLSFGQDAVLPGLSFVQGAVLQNLSFV